MSRHRIAAACLPLFLCACAAAPPAEPPPPACVRAVTVAVRVPALHPWPGSLPSVAILSPETPGDEALVKPGSGPRFQALLQGAFLERLPAVKVIERALPTLDREDPGVEVPGTASVLEVRLNCLRFVPSADGSGVDVEVACSMRLRDFETADVHVSHHYSDRIHFSDEDLRALGDPDDESLPLRAALQAAADSFFRVVCGRDTETRVLLFEAGPRTAGAIRAAADGDLTEAKRLFAEAEKADRERSAAAFGLSALLRLEGREAEANAALERALDEEKKP